MQQGFSGCLRDISVKMTDGPAEEWKSLDWTTATKKVAVYESWEGCPVQTEDGAHFLGHGRFLFIVEYNITGYDDFLLIFSCTLTLFHATKIYVHQQWMDNLHCSTILIL